MINKNKNINRNTFYDIISIYIILYLLFGVESMCKFSHTSKLYQESQNLEAWGQGEQGHDDLDFHKITLIPKQLLCTKPK